MLYYRNNRGPRGRMYGHGGRRPGLMILGILGLIGFAPVGLAVLFGLLVGVMGVFGGLIGAAGGLIGATAEIMSEMPSGLAKLLDVFNSQLFVVESVDGDELVQMKQAQKEKRILNEKKKKAREAYLAAIVAGDPAAIRKVRNTVVSTLARGEAKIFLRDKNVPEPTAPFLIRVTRTLKDNPDCEFDKSKTILANIRALESLQRIENNVLRSHLIHALWLARKMYPNDSSTAAGRIILSAAEASVKSRPNGWYTFGGPDAAAALRAFVDYLVLNEQALLASVSRPVTSGANATSVSAGTSSKNTSSKKSSAKGTKQKSG